jgi:hypothetical protein
MSDRELQQRIVDLQHALDTAHRRVRELETIFAAPGTSTRNCTARLTPCCASSRARRVCASATA